MAFNYRRAICIFFLNSFFQFLYSSPIFGSALSVGIGKTDITPPIGTPSAGYMERKGAGMEGVHDPLQAIALFIDNGEKQIAFCSVDNLGFNYEMIQAVINRVHQAGLERCEVYVGSSHTHSGGGGYLNIPVIGPALAGAYDAELTEFYIEKTSRAIIEASQTAIEGKIGIGYGKCRENLSKYRGKWPENVTPLSDMTVIKVTRQDGTPFAVLFNYAMHPTVMRGQNRLFSADFVGPAREHVQSLLGRDVQPIYFNGAQGDIIPQTEDNSFETCNDIGKSLAETVQKIWDRTSVGDALEIATQKITYEFQPKPTPAGMKLPIENYQTEINSIVLNKIHAFITIPGELSTVYDVRLKKLGSALGYDHVSIFGLTNDAHGYMILPAAWRKKTLESNLSFGWRKLWR
jgi:hypothetical protein